MHAESGVCTDGIIQIFVKSDASSPVAPAAYCDSNSQGSRMARGINDVDSVDRESASHSLRPDADSIDTVFKKLLHISGAFILIV